jgi:RNA polymerase-binding protein DksA
VVAPPKETPAKARKAAKETAPAAPWPAVQATPTPRPAAKPAKKAAKKAPAKGEPRKYVVRADEAPWTTAELNAIKAEILADTKRLKAELAVAEEEIADLLRDSGDGAGDDQADAGTKTFEREHEMSLANNSREMLFQNDRALERIKDGTYGVCESCGKPIGKARLQVFPRATLCVSCKQHAERR